MIRLTQVSKSFDKGRTYARIFLAPQGNLFYNPLPHTKSTSPLIVEEDPSAACS
jgi:hypothetical protein